MARTYRSKSVGPALGQRDKRRARRRDVIYPVMIESLAGDCSIPCLIQDISETGARLALRDVADIPDEFLLRLAENRAPNRHCKVVWQDELSVGVSFIEEMTPEIG